VNLTPRAREAITSEISRTPQGYETGGLLFARRTRDNTARITEAWAPGPSAIRRRAGLRLDWLTDMHAAKRKYDQSEGTLVPCGLRRAHPDTDNDTPSRADLAIFGELYNLASNIYPTPYFVGLIATPETRTPPPITAWVVRHNRLGDLICERSQLQDRVKP
jgi:hypothetical protein